jgi:hypothetical protein
VTNWIWTAQFFGHRLIEEALFAGLVISGGQILREMLERMGGFPFRFPR